MSIVGTCAKGNALLAHVPRMIISIMNDAFWSMNEGLRGSPNNLACVAARVQTTHWTSLQSSRTHLTSKIICCSLEVIPILRSSLLCTVIVPQHVAILGESHATLWQTHALQRSKKWTNASFSSSVSCESSELSLLENHQKLGSLESENHQEA